MGKKSQDFSILVVDDDDAVRDSLRTVLSFIYDDVRDFSSGEAVLAVVHRDLRGCLIIDIHMPDLTGLEVMEELAARSLKIPTILMTGRGDSILRSRAENYGAIALLDKPLDHDKLIAAIEQGRRQFST